MRTLLAALLLLVAAMAGCFGGDDDPEPTPTPTGTSTPTSSPTTAPTPTGSSEPEPEPTPTGAPNQPPEASITVDVDNGEVGLTVTFTLDGSDPDGDALTWTFDANGDGTFEAEGNDFELPAEVTFTYDEAGNFTAVLSISDGKETRNVNRLIVVQAPEVPEFEDRGWYFFEIATGMCHVKDYEDMQGLGILYRSVLSGGDWFIAEANDVSGLQIENNFPDQTSGQFSLDIPDCVDGDQVML